MSLRPTLVHLSAWFFLPMLLTGVAAAYSDRAPENFVRAPAANLYFGTTLAVGGRDGIRKVSLCRDSTGGAGGEWAASVMFSDGVLDHYVLLPGEGRGRLIDSSTQAQRTADMELGKNVGFECPQASSAAEVAYQFVFDAKSLDGYVAQKLVRTAPFDDMQKAVLRAAAAAAGKSVEMHQRQLPTEPSWGLAKS